MRGCKSLNKTCFISTFVGEQSFTTIDIFNIICKMNVWQLQIYCSSINKWHIEGFSKCM